MRERTGITDLTKKAVPSPWLVPFDGSFSIAGYPTRPPDGAANKNSLKESLADVTDQLADLQRILYANSTWSMLLIFQAMDAAGKDSTIRAVMEGVDPAGCDVYSFQQPSHNELAHDFLWRTAVKLPARGRIGIFNRSYYEEVLIVRVHPQLLDAQGLPGTIDRDSIWQQRFESITSHEEHLARSGTLILKFWLNVSREEQKNRFLSRLNEPQKNWKFSLKDVEERKHWDDYMHAYQQALAATSRPWAPWYAIPADDKAYMRVCVADIIVATLRSLGLDYPRIGPDEHAQFESMREILAND